MAALHCPPHAQRGVLRVDQAEEGGRAGDPPRRLRRAGFRAAHEARHLACEEIAGFCPKAAGLPEGAEADALVYLGFPYAHHRRLRANNMQERANRELKRRSCVVRVFPSRASLMRMLGAVFSEMDEDWASRRWFTGEPIALASLPAKPAVPAAAYDGTPEGHARRIMDVVVADNPIRRRAA